MAGRTRVKVRAPTRARIAAKARAQFPARVLGTDGITVTKVNGVFTFAINADFFPDFSDALPFTAGDTFYASGTSSIGKVAKAATGNVLLSGDAPTWGKVDLTAHITDNLPVSHLGSGLNASARTFWRGDGSWVSLPIYWLEDFGVIYDDVGAASANATAINLAMAYLASIGGGILEGKAGVVYVGASLDNKYSHVLLRGPPGTIVRHDSLELHGLIFIATGDFVVLRHRTEHDELGQARINTGGGFENISVDGQGLVGADPDIGAHLLRVDSIRNGIHHLFLRGAVGTEAALYTCGITDTDLSDACDVQGCSIDLTVDCLGTGADNTHAVTLDGSTNANFSYNYDVKIHGLVKNGHAVNAIAADNNRMAVTSTITGSGLTVMNRGSTATRSGSFSNRYTQIGGPAHSEGTETAGVTVGVTNIIESLDVANASPDPTAGTGSVWLWDNNASGTRHGGAFANILITDTATRAHVSAQRAAMGNESARIYNVNEDHLRFVNAAASWGAAVTSNGFRIAQLSGSAGRLNLGDGGNADLLGGLKLGTLQDAADTTKQASFVLSGITAGQTRALTVPNFNGTIATLAGVETFTNKAITAPTIAGGTHTAITSLGIRSTGTGAFDLTIANTENLTAGRTLTVKVNDAARTIDLAGNLTLAAAFATSGANALTLTTTGSTNVTLPTTGTLATTAGASIPSLATGDILYASAANTLSALADIATGNALISGGVGVALSWGKIGISTHVSGLGTGVATALAINVGSAGAPVTFNGALGTPSSGTATNLTGTAASLTAGTVTTNANLTGVITSVGNATSIASQTGTGTKFVVDTGPTLVTPILGVATATSINKVAITAPASSATLTIADGKTATHNASTTFAGTDGKTITISNSGTLSGGDGFTLVIAANKTATISNTLTFAGTDGSSVAFGAGGTAAYTGNKLSVFAATSSSELAGVISDETGSGALVFGTQPTLTGGVTFGAGTLAAGPSAGQASGDPNKLTLSGGSSGVQFNKADNSASTGNVSNTGAWSFPLVSTTASAANAFLDNAASNNLLRSTSSLRYKRDVEPLEDKYADAALDLEPIWYRSKAPADNPDWSWYGLASEEVAEIDPRLVHWSYPESAYKGTGMKRCLRKGARKVPDGVQYERLTVLLLSIVKRMHRELMPDRAAA
jgi:hypothetical protein